MFGHLKSINKLKLVLEFINKVESIDPFLFLNDFYNILSVFLV